LKCERQEGEGVWLLIIFEGEFKDWFRRYDKVGEMGFLILSIGVTTLL